MTYRLKNRTVLDAWADKEPDEAIRLRVARWLFRLADDPTTIETTPVPVVGGLPLNTTVVPGTKIAVTFVLIKSPPYPPSAAALILRDIRSVEE